MLIREERPADQDEVQAVHRAAFGSHGPVVAALVGDLRQLITAAGGLSLVAEVDEQPEQPGRLVGSVLFTPALLDAPQRLVTVEVLSPLGVLPAWQGRGIGAALVRHGVRQLAARSVPAVFLEGSPRYYPRLGFSPGGPAGYRRPSLRIPEAAFQVLQLPAHEPWMTGTLVYPSAFWDHDCVGLRDATA